LSLAALTVTMSKPTRAFQRYAVSPIRNIQLFHAFLAQPAPAKSFIGLFMAGLLVVSANSAMAADFPPNRPNYSAVAPAGPYDWSGFYLGVHAGYGRSDNEFNLVDATVPLFAAATSSLSPKSSGLLGGIQGGANHQFGNWLFGMEADVSMIDGTSAAEDPVGGSLAGVFLGSVQSEINWLATFTSRLGYAVDRSLIYIKGGVAAGAFEESFTLHNTMFFLHDTLNNTRMGWTVGAGLEYALFANWSVKVEYNYLDFGTKTETFSFSAGGENVGVNQDIEHRLHLVKAGFNYKFGGGYR
jgi:outer membrane immunogenic protein